jgi:DNA-binding PadR family transcriptional regulator
MCYPARMSNRVPTLGQRLCDRDGPPPPSAYAALVLVLLLDGPATARGLWVRFYEKTGGRAGLGVDSTLQRALGELSRAGLADMTVEPEGSTRDKNGGSLARVYTLTTLGAGEAEALRAALAGILAPRPRPRVLSALSQLVSGAKGG